MSTVPMCLAPSPQAQPSRPCGRVSSRALAAAGALSLMLAAAALQSLAGERAPVAPPVRSGGLSHDGLLSLPPAAQGPVSATLGADVPVYRVTPSKSGFAAMSPGQRLSSRFDRAGVSLSAGATRLRLGLQAVGYGSSLTALGAVTPSATANRVLYAHGALSEWYANGPLGLEQGFTVARAPSGRAAGPLTLAMALSGDTNPSLAPGGQSVTFSHAGGPALRYGSLSVADARGRALRSWLQLQGGRLLLRVDTRGARYPLRIDPLIHQGEKLTVSGLAGPYGYVGMSVALSADGNTALIGAPADNSGASGLEYHGAAWVFTRSGSTWTQQGEKLTGGGESGGGWFGQSVALSADGNTALIGAPNDDHEVGAAWVFTRSGSTWTQQGEKLSGSGEAGEGYFARSVALSADGNTALVGGYDDNEHRGAAWVFTRSGSTWAKQGEALTGAGASGYSWFGYSVALSADGDTALVGAPHGDGYAGTGLVFTRSGSTWTQQGEPLTGSEEINGEFGGELGYSAALSASGNTALLGGRVDNDFHGAAWAFERSGSTWAQEGAKLTGSEEGANREEFGWSVALSSSGDTALVGSPCDKACVGSASVFVNSTPPPSPPEYGRCTKVAKGAGRYASSSCTLPAARPTTNGGRASSSPASRWPLARSPLKPSRARR